MPIYRAPGVYVEEVPSGTRPIAPVSTSIAAFVGVTEKGPVGRATLVTSLSDFQRRFGGALRIIPTTAEHYVPYAVPHFFAQGGGQCYVVRVVHFDNANDAAAVAADNLARSASAAFDGTDVAAAAVSPALTVHAIDPGVWGRRLSVRVINSARVALRLASDVAAGAAVDQIALARNEDVRIGSLLWLVDEVTGRVESVAPTNAADPTGPGAVTFVAASVQAGGSPFAGNITAGLTAFGPDLVFLAAASGPDVAVTAGTPAGPIQMTALGRSDGRPLRAGDTVSFAMSEIRLVVTRLSEPPPGSPPATIAHFAPVTLTSFPAASSRVYERGFTLEVRSDGEAVEVHENLSLVDGNLTDHVEQRLGPDSGGSLFIAVQDDPAVDDRSFVNNAPATALSGGDDGLTGLNDADFVGSEVTRTGLHALDRVRDVSILAVPNASPTLVNEVITYCDGRRDLFYIVDGPRGADSAAIASFRGALQSQFGALYHPWIQVDDALTGRPLLVPPSGAVAGIYAKTDRRRGVHKAPAGIECKVAVATGLERLLTKADYDGLYPSAINAILKFRAGIFVWGSRTLSADPEWLQINVRRLFIFLEKSIESGTQWVPFEPNGPSLWKTIERNVAAFLRIQWSEGKLVGTTESEAFFVRCNEETNPPEVVNAGQVITVIGVAPSRPAEFVIFRIKQFLASEG